MIDGVVYLIVKFVICYLEGEIEWGVFNYYLEC